MSAKLWIWAVRTRLGAFYETHMVYVAYSVVCLSLFGNVLLAPASAFRVGTQKMPQPRRVVVVTVVVVVESNPVKA